MKLNLFSKILVRRLDENQTSGQKISGNIQNDQNKSGAFVFTSPFI